MKKDIKKRFYLAVTMGMMLMCTNSCELILLYSLSVQTTAATDITSTSATLNGEVISTGIEQVVFRGFYLSESHIEPYFQSGRGIRLELGKGRFSAKVMDLKPGTTYYVMAYALYQYTEGYPAYGKEITFSTPGNVVDNN